MTIFLNSRLCLFLKAKKEMRNYFHTCAAEISAPIIRRYHTPLCQMLKHTAMQDRFMAVFSQMSSEHTRAHTRAETKSSIWMLRCCWSSSYPEIWLVLVMLSNVKHTSCVGVMAGNRFLLVPSCQWLCCGSREPGSGGVGPQAEWLCVSWRGMWCATALIRCCFSAETCLESPQRLLQLVFIAWELLLRAQHLRLPVKIYLFLFYLQCWLVCSKEI